MDSSDYAKMPYGFVVCASTDCPKASTCLRHMALEFAPATVTSLPTLTPKTLRGIKGQCPYYSSNTKVRYAKGFVHIMDQFTVKEFLAFKTRLVDRYGRKKYLMFRNGTWLIKPADQQYIIRSAKKHGLNLEDYFDGYIEAYLWE